jgi:hypothetical protein
VNTAMNFLCHTEACHKYPPVRIAASQKGMFVSYVYFDNVKYPEDSARNIDLFEKLMTTIILYFCYVLCFIGGTMLQAGRLRARFPMSLDFFKFT